MVGKSEDFYENKEGIFAKIRELEARELWKWRAWDSKICQSERMLEAWNTAHFRNETSQSEKVLREK